MCNDVGECSRGCALYSATGFVFTLYVGILLSTQSFFLQGIEDVEKAQSSAYGATTMFAITFFASLGGIWYDSMYKKEPTDDLDGKYHLSKDDVPLYGTAT